MYSTSGGCDSGRPLQPPLLCRAAARLVERHDQRQAQPVASPADMARASPARQEAEQARAASWVLVVKRKLTDGDRVILRAISLMNNGKARSWSHALAIAGDTVKKPRKPKLIQGAVRAPRPQRHHIIAKADNPAGSPMTPRAWTAATATPSRPLFLELKGVDLTRTSATRR